MSSIKKILIAVVEIGAIIALSYLIPGSGLLIAGIHVSAFAALAIGTAIITTAFGILSSILLKPASSGSASIDASTINVRLSTPPRWLNAGAAIQGGAIAFADFDAAGNFWYLLIHCDSILATEINHYFDDIALTFTPSGEGGLGWVTNSEFCLNDKKEAYPGYGTLVHYFHVWTSTYTETNPIPPAINPLQSAFPTKWTTIDHLLAGTTYTVVRINAIDLENRYKIYKWRGSTGLGEPSVSIAGQWSNMYDPRDPDQILGNRATYKPSRNSALVWAWFRTHPYGRAKSENSINWLALAHQADLCDDAVTGIAGTQARYECGTAIVDNKERSVAEQEIMLSCDGQLVFDEDGKTWLRVGYYETPTLYLSRNRDIITMQSVEAQNGESQTQGVVVYFLDPSAGYTRQPAAPWYNPNYYVEGQGANFLSIDILTIQNHNQAMRVAKALGMRSQPLHKIAPAMGLRGLQAMQERIINITYDNTFAGDYEICTPVDVDESGLYCSIGLVPMDPDRFDLLPGEEKPQPVAVGEVVAIPPDPPTINDVLYNNGRIEIDFAIPNRDDVIYQFEYISDADLAGDKWSRMNVNMVSGLAYSGAIDHTQDQHLRWKASTSGGLTTGYEPDPPEYYIFAGVPVVTPTDGTNNATVYIYQRSASAPSTPSVPATYTFGTGVTGLNNGWSASIQPPDGNPLYVSQALASSSSITDAIAPSDWSTPVLFTRDGTDGLPGNDGSDAPLLLVQWSANNSSWHSTYSPGDAYVRFSADNGVTWGLGALIQGGEVAYAFIRSGGTPASPPSSPGSNTRPPTGWYNTDPGGAGLLFYTFARFDGSGYNLTGWSGPVQIQGSDGMPGAPGASAPNVIVQGSIDGISGWHTPTGGDQYLRTSNDGGATYTAAVKITGEDGSPGVDGQYLQQVFKRATSTPSTPTGNGIPSGWSDGIPTGSDPIYQSSATQRNGVSLTVWSAPALIGAIGGAAPPSIIYTYIDNDGTYYYAQGMTADPGVSVYLVVDVHFYGGPRTQTVTAEYTIDGGASWNSLGSNTNGPVGAGDDADASLMVSYTNSSGSTVVVRFRATTTHGGSGGNIDPQSFMYAHF